MRIHVVTSMPELVAGALSHGLIGQAQEKGLWQLNLINPRAFTADAHHTIDDRVFGGGDGMLMLAEPLAQALDSLKTTISTGTRVVMLSPRGRLFNAAVARQWAEELTPGAGEARDLVLIAGRYAGVDERFTQTYCTDEISIGDYVVSGGELPAAVIIDAVLRHIPGVLGNSLSAASDSFSQGQLEAPQYTRPREWRGKSVPAVLLSGDHQKIAAWNELAGLLATLKQRPDLAEAGRLGVKTKLEQHRRLARGDADLGSLVTAIESLPLDR